MFTACSGRIMTRNSTILPAASDAASFASSRSIQLHGGIGFTWECDVHIYVKRQKHNQFYFGDGPYQRAKIADLIAA